MFMSLGASIRGFKSCIRPVLCVDACFLKHKVGGRMLVAIALDANDQLYPVAFGVVDCENNDSWNYFMTQLKVAIGSVPNLVFVSDRHQSIAAALSEVFPEAHHGACTYHLKMNMMAKFKTDHCHNEFDWAANAYRISEFERHFENIRAKDPRIADYLEAIGFDRWSRAHFPGIRYNVMTSNYAESFNSLSRHARRYPISTMVDFLRFTLQDWFQQRRQLAANSDGQIATRYDQKLKDDFQKAMGYTVYSLNDVEYFVQDGGENAEVNLHRKTCSCRVFDLTGLTCRHALAASRVRKWDVHDLCSKYYKTQAWINSYAETIYPVNNIDWDIPDEIKQLKCLKPLVKVKKGRPATKRKRSNGEVPKIQKRCSSCGNYGHNRSTCRYTMLAPSTQAQATMKATRPGKNKKANDPTCLDPQASSSQPPPADLAAN